jgi:hypothetical protein
MSFLLNSFFNVYVIPKKTARKPFPLDLEEDEVVNSLNAFYQNLIEKPGLLDKIGPTALISYDRFLSVGSSFYFDVFPKLKASLIARIEQERNFPAELFEKKTICLPIDPVVSKIDDYCEKLLPLTSNKISTHDENAYTHMLPVFILSSNDKGNALALLMDQFNKLQTSDQLGMSQLLHSPIQQKIARLNNQHKFFTGVVTSLIDVKKLTKQTKSEVAALLNLDHSLKF